MFDAVMPMRHGRRAARVSHHDVYAVNDTVSMVS